MYRLYIEDFNPPIWAIDKGIGTKQQRYEKVITNCVGFTKYDLEADNENDPKTWVEYPDSVVLVVGKTAIIRSIK